MLCSPVLLASGDKALNQAIKGLAIARTYLAEKLKGDTSNMTFDVEVQPEFRTDGGMYLILRKFDKAGPERSKTVPAIEDPPAPPPTLRERNATRANSQKDKDKNKGKDGQPPTSKRRKGSRSKSRTRSRDRDRSRTKSKERSGSRQRKKSSKSRSKSSSRSKKRSSHKGSRDKDKSDSRSRSRRSKDKHGSRSQSPRKSGDKKSHSRSKSHEKSHSRSRSKDSAKRHSRSASGDRAGMGVKKEVEIEGEGEVDHDNEQYGATSTGDLGVGGEPSSSVKAEGVENGESKSRTEYERATAEDDSGTLNHGGSEADGSKPKPHTPMEMDESKCLRVAHSSDPYVVAGAIAKKIRRGEQVELLSIGGGSVSTTTRAIAYSRKYLMENRIAIAFSPSFVHLSMAKDDIRSGMKFVMYPWKIPEDPSVASSTSSSSPPPSSSSSSSEKGDEKGDEKGESEIAEAEGPREGDKEGDIPPLDRIDPIDNADPESKQDSDHE